MLANRIDDANEIFGDYRITLPTLSSFDKLAPHCPRLNGTGERWDRTVSIQTESGSECRTESFPVWSDVAEQSALAGFDRVIVGCRSDVFEGGFVVGFAGC
jgi:hypothetical protein